MDSLPLMWAGFAVILLLDLGILMYFFYKIKRIADYVNEYGSKEMKIKLSKTLYPSRYRNEN